MQRLDWVWLVRPRIWLLRIRAGGLIRDWAAPANVGILYAGAMVGDGRQWAEE